MQTVTTQVGSVNLTFNDLITETQAAEILGVTPGTLAVWRCTKRYKITYIKVGRSVRYSRKSLQAWIDQRTQNAGI